MKLANYLLAAAVAVVLSGCSSMTVPLQPHEAVLNSPDAAKQALFSAQSCCASLSALKYQPLAEGDTLLTIDGASQVYKFQEGLSYLAAYQLPTNTGDMVVKVAAQVGKSVLMPQVLMLNSNFEVTRVLGKSLFSYKPAHLLDNDRIEGTIYVSRNALKPEAYMVIYSPATELSGSTTILHPAKAFARATSTQEPPVNDPVIPHSPWGLVKIELVDRAKLEGVDNVFKSEYSDKLALSQGVQPSAMALGAGAGAVAATAIKNQPAVATPTMLGETENFYLTQIEIAVQAGDIDKAMKLVDEAERAGSTKAKTTFVEAVKRSQK
ncbi:MalM family protein [Aeromonas veronii]|uniref:MalM family protein n=1 Tax=Aeromonas veronii TaxID=654 RepID=UPI00406BB424